MYMRLLYYANGARYKASGGEWVFRKWVAVTSKELIRDVCKNRNALRKIRDELAQAGYIRYKPGAGNGATEYMLVSLTKKVKDPEVQEMPKKTAPTGSFNTDDFFAAAVRKTFGEKP